LKLKISLIGVGRFGKNHLRVLKELENKGLCTLYGVVDINTNTLEKIGKEYKVRTSTSIDSFLDKVDAVIIATPSNTHFEVCLKCLDYGKHVLVEKPLTTTYATAKELVQLAEKQRKILMVGHIFRYNKAVWKIKSLIDKKELGDIYYMFGHFMGLKDPRYDVGAVFNYAVHHIDIYNYLLDKMPEEVNCCCGYFLGRKNFEDLFILVLRYPSNIMGIIEGSWLPPGKYRNLTIVGSRKSVVSNLLEQKIEVYSSFISKCDGRLKAIFKGKVEIPVDFEEPLKLELLDFIKSIKTGKKPLADAKSGLNAVLIAEKALESAKLKRTVRII